MTSAPHTATLSFGEEEVTAELTLIDPQPLSALSEALAECWEVQIVDLNLEQGTQLEFGRYRVEFWDEDNPFATLVCDKFDVSDKG